MPSPAAAETPDLDAWYRSEVLIHEPAIRAYLKRAFPIVTDPDNIVQETFTRVLAAHRQGRVSHVRGYLFATARNLAVAMIRRRDVISIEPIAEIEDLDVTSPGPGVADQVSLQFDLEVLKEAIQSLPERCREVLVLRKIEGLSQREIAERMGISEHTVEAQVANGMRRCTEFFRQRGYLSLRKVTS